MNKKNFLELIKNRVLICDGAYGTMLHQMGLPDNVPPEQWNLTNRKRVQDLHAKYISAGADIITTNTFGANTIRLENYKLHNRLQQIIKMGVKAALEAKKKSGKKVLVAGSIGPTGIFMHPFGELTFDEVFAIYSQVVKIFNGTGIDLLMIETMTDIQELKACLLAAKTFSNKPKL